MAQAQRPGAGVYVIADVATGGGSQAHPRAPVLPDPYPPADSTLPAPVQADRGGAMWTFPLNAAGFQAAHQFGGALQAVNPGLRVGAHTTAHLKG